MKADKAIRFLQRLCAARFGNKRGQDSSGEATLYIGCDHVELTNNESVISARGPAQVARVLRRRRRK